MTVEEIFIQLANHMVEGIMMHEQLANYYDFLGLKGYKRCQEYHFLEETGYYRSVCRYFINHYNKLIPYSEINIPSVIPESWYKYTRQDVNSSTKQNAVKNGLNVWLEWEKKTKRLYEKLYKELIDIDEVASAIKVKQLICDVDMELKKVERYQLDKEAMGYDMPYIIEEQQRVHKKYDEKEKEIGVSIC